MFDVLSRNNVKQIGTGSKTILFAHGFGCDQKMWRAIVPAFQNDYSIVLFDYVGAGQSDITTYNPTRYKSLDGYAQDIIEICDTLQISDVIFVGHSVSSMIGALGSIKRPDLFSSLIMVCPSPCYINKGEQYTGGFEEKDIRELLKVMDKNYMGWASTLAPMVVQNPELTDITDEFETRFCSTDPVILKQFAEVTFLSDNRKDLPKITTPTLILQCQTDVIAPPIVGHYVHKNIEKSILTILNATGHCPHMSHPKLVINAISDYLNNVD